MVGKSDITGKGTNRFNYIFNLIYILRPGEITEICAQGMSSRDGIVHLS